MPELTCRLHRVKALPKVAVVAISGSIDPRNLATLDAALSSPNGKDFHTVVLDLGQIRYINSAGLAFLVNLADAMVARGGGLHLANAQPKVKVVFDLMGVSQFFRLHKSVDSALRRTAAFESLHRAPKNS